MKGSMITMDKKVKIKAKQAHDELNQTIKKLLANKSAANHKKAMRLQRVLVDLQSANSVEYVQRIIVNANLILDK